MVEILLLIESSKTDENKIMNHSKSVSDVLKTSAKSCLENLNPNLYQLRDVLEKLVGAVEMFAITIILCGNLKSCIKSAKKNLKKGKDIRKKKCRRRCRGNK